MGRKTIVNQIVSPELLEQVNPKNQQLKRDYLNYLRSVDRSTKTIFQYESDLNIFFVWLLRHDDNKCFVDLRKRDIINFQNYLIYDNYNSPARVRRMKATLSSLSNYISNILDDEYPSFHNIVHGIESPQNIPVKEKTVLSEDQCTSLLDELVNRGEYEKACCAALAMFSGRRKAELVQFKVSYFDDDNIVFGSLYRTPETIRTKGRGSVGKPLVCYTLSKRFKPYFDLWMKYRNEHKIESEWLFPDTTDPSQHVADTTLTSWAKTFSRILGVPVHMHVFRHFFATALRKSGLPDKVIVKIIGWGDKKGNGGQSMLDLYDDSPAEDSFGDYFKDGEIVAHSNKSLSDL